MRPAIRLAIVLSIVSALAACIEPDERRPGLRLSGETVETPPGDWKFTNDYEKIAVEVRTPYLLPHSVTIWCAEVGGKLYVGARDPETKSWPGWADRNPDVRLRVGNRVFEVRLAPLDDPARIESVKRAYAAKYGLPPAPEGEGPPVRYWRVEPRS